MIKFFFDISKTTGITVLLLLFCLSANAQTLYTDYTPDYKTDYKAYILDKIEFRQNSTVFFFRFVCDNEQYNGATFFSKKGTFPWYLKLDNGGSLDMIALRNFRRDEVLVAATAPEPNFYIPAIEENPYTVFTCEIHFPKLPTDVTFVDMVEGKGMEKSDHFNCFNVRVKEEDDKDLGDERMRQEAIYKFEKRYGIEQNAPMKTEDEMITANTDKTDDLASDLKNTDSGVMQVEDDLPLPEEEPKKTVRDASNPVKLKKWEDMDCGKRLILEDIAFYDNTAQVKGWVKARQTLGMIKQYMFANPDARLVLYGHTDIFGDAEAMKNLSKSRAKKLQRYLSGTGVAAGRIDIQAVGNAEPLFPDGDPANRRVEMELFCE